MLAQPIDRVFQHTNKNVNKRIREDTEKRIKSCLEEGTDAVDKRLRQLTQEWDVERVLEASSSALILGGLALATTYHRRFLILPTLVSGFLLQHALQGWCPPLPMLRRLGFRTAYEIEEERFRLLASRSELVR